MKAEWKFADERVRWYLEAVAGESPGWRIAIEPFPFIIGRDEECNLQLTEKLISRRHAEIHMSGDHLWIRDLKSTNGTFVNHKKIERAEVLEPDDIVSIGKFKFSLKHVQSSEFDMAEETCAIDVTNKLNYLAEIEPKLRALLRDRSVVPHFQPVIRFSDKSLEGYEILGRVADKGLPENPSDLLELAEWLGCSSELSAAFREVGVEVGKDLPESKFLFVNSTPLEIYQLDALLKSMEKTILLSPFKKIVLEINEKAAGTHEMPRLRSRLKELGVGLAFDDFGTGQIRLVELAQIPPDFLKFDQSLIRQIHLAPERLHQVICTFVKAAKDLGITTLAEGIETEEEAETCHQLGFDMAQGFHFGKPLPIGAVKSAGQTGSNA